MRDNILASIKIESSIVSYNYDSETKNTKLNDDQLINLIGDVSSQAGKIIDVGVSFFSFSRCDNQTILFMNSQGKDLKMLDLKNYDEIITSKFVQITVPDCDIKIILEKLKKLVK